MDAVKIQKVLLIAFAVVAYRIGDWIFHSGRFDSWGMFIFAVGRPLMIASITLFVTASIVAFLRKKVFYTWVWFTLVYSIISSIIIVKTPTVATGYVGFVDKFYVTQALSILFFISSILLFIIVSLRNQR